MNSQDSFFWFDKGYELCEQSRFEDALQAFERAIELDPNDADPWYGKGNALHELGRFKDALRAYERAIELDPNYVVPWYSKGKALGYLGRFEEALQAYERAIELDPNYVFAWNGKGNVLHDLGRFEDALRAYERAIELDPNDAAPWNDKGNILHDLGRFDKALRAYERAIELDPNYAAPWYGKGNALGDLGRFEEALRAFECAIELDPNYADPWYGKGKALHKQGRFEDALRAYERAIELDPNYAAPWYGKGNALGDLGRFEEALQAYERAIELDPNDAAPWYGKGYALNQLGRFEDALRAYERAIELDPNDAVPWNGKGNALDDLGCFEEALRAYERAIELDPNYAAPWNGKGNILVDLGRFEEALRAFERSIKLEPNHAAWNGKGNALHQQGRFEEALRAFEWAIELDPNDAAPWHGKGNALYRLGRVEEALRAYEWAIELDPNDAAPWHGKGNALYGLGRFEEALRAYEWAIELDPNDALPWNGKGNALDALDRFAEALQAYERAIELDPNLGLPWHGKGNALHGLDRSEEARRAYMRCCFLASPREIMKVSGGLLRTFYQSGQQAPLLVLRLAARTRGLLAENGWFAAVRDLREAYAVPLVCLEALSSMETDGTPDRLRAAGCLAFHLGDPMAAEDYFDALEDAFPADCLGQYYLVCSRYGYCADNAACLEGAVATAAGYGGEDPEQYYYAANIFLFADKQEEAAKALQNAGEYGPALLLRWDAARERGDLEAQTGLARRFLDLERDTAPELRFLHPTLPDSFDLSTPHWLRMVLQYAKQQELMGEIGDFLKQLDEPSFFELRHAYADVLLETHTGAWDLTRAWNLNAASRAFVDALLAERDEADLARMRTELEVDASIPLEKIEALADHALEERLASRLKRTGTRTDLSFDGERRLYIYLYKTRRLDFKTSFLLRLYSLARENGGSPGEIRSVLFDGYLAVFSSVGGSLSGGAAVYLGLSLPASLGAIAGPCAATVLASFVWRHRSAAREAAVPDLDYAAFKDELQALLKKERFDLPQVFWEQAEF